MQLTQQMQDALIQILDASDLFELESQLLNSLNQAIPSHVGMPNEFFIISIMVILSFNFIFLHFETQIKIDSVAYILNTDGDVRDLMSSRGVVHVINRTGVLYEAFENKCRSMHYQLKSPDPLASLIILSSSSSAHSDPSIQESSKGILCCRVAHSSPTTQKSIVICSPILDTQNNEVVGCYALSCHQLSDDEYQFLTFLERQFLQCYRCIIRSKSTHIQNQHDAAILKLCAELHDQDATVLQTKIIQYVLNETHSEVGFLLLRDKDRQELFCQVICGRRLEGDIRFPILDNSFSTIVDQKKTVTLQSFEPVHLKELEKHIPCQIKSSLCVPILCRATGQVLALICIINKMDGSYFTENDEMIIKHCFTYTAPVLHSAIAIQNERIVRNQTQVLLQVAKNLFTHLGDLTQLLSEIMQEARNLTQAERCSVFLLDKDANELIAKVFDVDASGSYSNKSTSTSEVRIPASKGIAGFVATSGEMMNIDDTYSHPMFYKGVDEATGFKTRNILCFPIKNEIGDVIGVAQLCNKLNGGKFTSFDENIAQAFSVYCCISIVHSLLYKKVTDSQHRSKLSNELMIYHMQVSQEEVMYLSLCPVLPPSNMNLDVCEFSFTPRKIHHDVMPQVVFSMFDELGFIAAHRIKVDSLAKFILMARKGYRDPPYHNWSHAFAVVHFCYLLFKKTKVLEMIDSVEAFSLFVSCLCHDIDHRGTTNSFQVVSGSVLAALYSSEGSVLERHHFAQTLCILNTEGCNIFENLSQQDYRRALDLVQEIILATDLAQHLKKERSLIEMSQNYNPDSRQHKLLLLCLLMTSCDLSDQTKSFENSKDIAERIYTEFFSQGDLEKQIGRDPMEMMDRDKAIIPDLQISFLNTIALPVYRMLANVLPDTRPVLLAAENNTNLWTRLNRKLISKKLPRNMEVFHININIEDDDDDVDDDDDDVHADDDDAEERSMEDDVRSVSPIDDSSTHL